MIKKGRVENLVSLLAEPISLGLGLELVDVEFVKEQADWFLRIYIDREGGITLEDCERMSRAVDKALDETDPIPHSYHLEVSSPGLERPLLRLSDFTRFVGERALVRTSSPIAGRRSFDGRIAGVDGDAVLMDLGLGAPVAIPFGAVAKANLVFEW